MAQTLSDFNTLGQKASNVSRLHAYSDLDLSLRLNQYGDIVPLTDIDAVKNSVRNLVLTNFMERAWEPDVGSNIRALLFEPADKFTTTSLKNAISE